MTGPGEDRPTVSVIVVVKNGEATIRRQLEALASQTGAPTFEVLVVDNGSTDRTVGVVEQWIADGIGAAMTTRVVDASARPGIPFARNTGARSSVGDVIAFCDADDEVHADWLAQLVHGLPGDGVVGGGTYAVNPDGTPHPTASRAGVSMDAYLPYVPTCNMAVTRRCLFETGGFDESLPTYGFEDVDFCWRAQELGFPLGFAPTALITFTVSDTATSVKKVMLLGKGRMQMIRRHPEFASMEYSVASCAP